jgi:hypothetical protein
MNTPNPPIVLTCDGARGCTAPITHIDAKGYIYCEAHAFRLGRGRQLTPAELKQLQAGEPVARY